VIHKRKEGAGSREDILREVEASARVSGALSEGRM
jgi:hypothetical protein